MIPLQIYDSTKTTIIPLVELWWNYRGGITKIVSERYEVASFVLLVLGSVCDGAVGVHRSVVQTSVFKFRSC